MRTACKWCIYETTDLQLTHQSKLAEGEITTLMGMHVPVILLWFIIL